MDQHFLTTRDWNGLNTGIFFIRVHEWSLNFLEESRDFRINHPSVELSVNGDQDAMAWLADPAHTGQFYKNVLYQPRNWYNSYQTSEEWEGREGNLLVHFPGLGIGREGTHAGVVRTGHYGANQVGTYR